MSVDKTESLERLDVGVDLLIPNDKNPNKMNSREFDLLCDNIQRVGITDAILVKPDGDKYRIIGGHHRWEAAKYLDFENVPVTVITDPDFDEEMETFQLVRHNAIHGKLDPQSFVDLYYEYAGKYDDGLLQEMFGFADDKEFQKLINQTAKQLPKEMQDNFKESAKELKTIDGLAKLLNTMFTKYGDTLPYGYMVVEYGSQRSVWVRVSSKTMKALDLVGTRCIEQKKTLDDVLGGLVQLIAKGDCEDLLEDILNKAPDVVLPEGLSVTPTKDNIEALEELKDG